MVFSISYIYLRQYVYVCVKDLKVINEIKKIDTYPMFKINNTYAYEDVFIKEFNIFKAKKSKLGKLIWK